MTQPLPGQGEEAMMYWAIYVCPVHPDAVRAIDSAPPGERPYCPHAKPEDPHKMRAVKVIPASTTTELREENERLKTDLAEERQEAADAWCRYNIVQAQAESYREALRAGADDLRELADDLNKAATPPDKPSSDPKEERS